MNKSNISLDELAEIYGVKKTNLVGIFGHNTEILL